MNPVIGSINMRLLLIGRKQIWGVGVNFIIKGNRSVKPCPWERNKSLLGAHSIGLVFQHVHGDLMVGYPKRMLNNFPQSTASK